MIKNSDYSPAIVIAELGCVHAGSMTRAKYLIKLAKESGANFVKFQKRNPIESVAKHLQNKPHPNEMFSYGKTYLEHRINLELNIEQHKELQIYCRNIGIGYSTSVWDITSAKEVIELNPPFIKIPSACNNNIKLLDYIKNNYNKQIHVSLGMTTKKDRNSIYDYFSDIKDRTILYHCTSIYPCPFHQLYLNEIKDIKEKWGTAGFSNHGFGIAADIAAFMLGARYIERHFVNDRTFRHTDSAASLEPAGLSKLCRDLNAVCSALKYRPDQLPEEEEKEKNKLRAG